MDRAFDYGSKGWGFDSLQVRFFFPAQQSCEVPARGIEALDNKFKICSKKLTNFRICYKALTKAMKKDPIFFMKKALQLAVRAEKCGEVPVGAVLVREGRVIGRGYNAPIAKNDPSAHAEIMALRRAGKKVAAYRLNGCELYVTLEPCLMCYSAMVHARIARLHYGAADAKNGIFSSGVFDNVKHIFNHRIAVEGGLLAQPASAMLSDFFKARRGAGAVERDGLENRCGG